MIEIKDLNFSYENGFRLNIPYFSVPKGKKALLRGPIGCGKSTLLSLIRGTLLPNRGSILIDNKDITKLKERERRFLRLKEIGSIFQQASLVPYLNILENLNINYTLENKKPPSITNQPLIEKLQLRPLLNKFPKELSGGEQQRVALARTFIHTPSIIIADEPTNHLDARHKRFFNEILSDFHNEDKTILVVSHDSFFEKELDLTIDFESIIR